MSITAAGEAFLPYCEKVVRASQEGHQLITNLNTSVSGHIKIAAPPAFATHCLAETVDDFCKAYPDVTIQLVLGPSLEQMIAQGFDIILRSAELDDSNLIVRKLVDLPLVVCASPSFINQYGLPERIDQLSSYRWGIYSHQSKHARLDFYQRQTVHPVEITSHIQCDSLNTLKALVMLGICLACLPQFMVGSEIAQHKLLPVLPTYQLNPSPLYVLKPARDHTPSAVSLFIEYLFQYSATSDKQ
ncbi:MAG: hypothetical protein CMF55_05385 [Legionellales bacterium]|nr:hypothetical protein [Legionellales bacterium]